MAFKVLKKGEHTYFWLEEEEKGEISLRARNDKEKSIILKIKEDGTILFFDDVRSSLGLKLSEKDKIVISRNGRSE